MTAQSVHKQKSVLQFTLNSCFLSFYEEIIYLNSFSSEIDHSEHEQNLRGNGSNFKRIHLQTALLLKIHDQECDRLILGILCLIISSGGLRILALV